MRPAIILIAALFAATAAAAQTPPPGPAHMPATPAVKAARAEARQDCAADASRFCTAGGERIGQCLKQHKAELSANCRNAMANVHQARMASGMPHG